MVYFSKLRSVAFRKTVFKFVALSWRYFFGNILTLVINLGNVLTNLLRSG